MSKIDKPAVIIVHGWASSPKRGWLSWLNRSLAQQGYEVEAPHLPNARRPELEQWINEVVDIAKKHQRIILVGHSLGTFTILHAVLRLPKTVKIEKIILVSGFYVDRDAKYWPEYVLSHKDCVQIQKRVAQRYVLYSTNDRVVEPSVSANLARQLAARLIAVANMGHFSNLKIKKLPIVLDAVIE